MKSILEYLERSASQYPDRVAFEEEQDTVTFRQLEQAAKQVGTELARIGCQRQPAVLLMEKSVRTIQLMMGAVYAGAFYVILDGTQPIDRLNRTLETLQPKVLLYTEKYRELAERLNTDCVKLAEAQVGQGPADDALLARVQAAQKDVDPLYVLFTSGSTGTPKGVVVCHRSVLDFIPEFAGAFGFTPEDVIGNQAPWDFDVSVKDIYTGLYVGAKVVLIPKPHFLVPMKLLDYLEEKQITNLTWAVSALTLVSAMNGLSYKVPDRIRRIMFSGEAMPARHLNYWREYYPDAMFVNLYGPTEITCNCTYYILDREFQSGEVIPIGGAFRNETVFLLDDENRQVTEPNVRGEICISGTALALGYYRNPEQTGKVFVQNPLNDAYLESIYRSGDMGYYNERGELCFSARRDFQIKHMGHRIELGEIENALEKVPEVREAVCLFDERRNRIVCFYQGDMDKKELSRALGAYLPDWMVPGAFRQLEELPRNKNGKIDRKALTEKLEERRRAARTE